MKRLTLLLLCLWSVLAGAAAAADRGRPVRIGVLTEGFGPTSGSVGLRDGLKELGYQEDKDFVIGVRFTQGSPDELPAAARQLVEQGVDVLFTEGRSAAKVAQKETTKIPIVFAGGGDPVGLGLIQSFARPGGNVTGVTDLDLEIGAKRLEVFKQLIPRLKRVLFPYNTTDAFSLLETKLYRDAAAHLEISLVDKPVRSEDEAKMLLESLKKGEVQGLLAPRPMTSNIPGYVRDAGTRLGIPTMFASTYFAENGGIASYTPDTYKSGRMAARLLDKIMKGTSPAQIPVEVNNDIELVVNLKVAQALGIKIVPEALSRANRVIR